MLQYCIALYLQLTIAGIWCTAFMSVPSVQGDLFFFFFLYYWWRDFKLSCKWTCRLQVMTAVSLSSCFKSRSAAQSWVYWTFKATTTRRKLFVFHRWRSLPPSVCFCCCTCSYCTLNTAQDSWSKANVGVWGRCRCCCFNNRNQPVVFSFCNKEL